jgi:hypothetical protein
MSLKKSFRILTIIIIAKKNFLLSNNYLFCQGNNDFDIFQKFTEKLREREEPVLTVEPKGVICS